MLSLKTELRKVEEKVSELRAAGKIPAVYYGRKEEATAIAVPAKEFSKVFQEAGESSVIVLETPKGKLNALIQDVQLDPVKDTPLHIDFYVIEAGKEVEVDVPLDFIGVSPAVKEKGGILVKVLHELPIKGKPDVLPHDIKVDISILAELDSHIEAKDVVLPGGVTLMIGPHEVVASISVAKEEEETTTEVDLSSIEVEKKGKKEEEPAE